MGIKEWWKDKKKRKEEMKELEKEVMEEMKEEIKEEMKKAKRDEIKKKIERSMKPKSEKFKEFANNLGSVGGTSEEFHAKMNRLLGSDNRSLLKKDNKKKSADDFNEKLKKMLE